MKKFNVPKYEAVGFLMNNLPRSPLWLNSRYHPLGYLLEGLFIFKAPESHFLGNWYLYAFEGTVDPMGNKEYHHVSFDVNCESSTRILRMIEANYDNIYLDCRQTQKEIREKLCDLLTVDIESIGWKIGKLGFQKNSRWNNRLAVLVDIHYSIYNNIDVKEMAVSYGLKYEAGE